MSKPCESATGGICAGRQFSVGCLRPRQFIPIRVAPPAGAGALDQAAGAGEPAPSRNLLGLVNGKIRWPGSCRRRDLCKGERRGFEGQRFGTLTERERPPLVL